MGLCIVLRKELTACGIGFDVGGTGSYVHGLRMTRVMEHWVDKTASARYDGWLDWHLRLACGQLGRKFLCIFLPPILFSNLKPRLKGNEGISYRPKLSIYPTGFGTEAHSHHVAPLPAFSQHDAQGCPPHSSLQRGTDIRLDDSHIYSVGKLDVSDLLSTRGHWPQRRSSPNVSSLPIMASNSP